MREFENWRKRFLTRSSLFILWLIHRKPMTGYDIVKVMRNDGIRVSCSFVYPMLTLLTDLGLIEVHEENTGKRKRKVYRITSKGRRYLHSVREKILSPLRKEFLRFLLEGD